jgi:enoyl-CoA hydratase
MATPEFKRTNMSRSGRTAVLALASDKVNALDTEVLQEISTFVEFCEQDPGVGALVVTGEGTVFSAGLNVNEVLGNEPSYVDVLLDTLNLALVRLFRCPKPTVAAINGSAIAGGCILAIACDKRLIAEEARIGVTELRVGVSFPIVAIELLRHACGPLAEQLISAIRTATRGHRGGGAAVVAGRSRLCVGQSIDTAIRGFGHGG